MLSFPGLPQPQEPNPPIKFGLVTRYSRVMEYEIVEGFGTFQWSGEYPDTELNEKTVEMVVWVAEHGTTDWTDIVPFEVD